MQREDRLNSLVIATPEALLATGGECSHNTLADISLLEAANEECVGLCEVDEHTEEVKIGQANMQPSPSSSLEHPVVVHFAAPIKRQTCDASQLHQLQPAKRRMTTASPSADASTSSPASLTRTCRPSVSAPSHPPNLRIERGTSGGFFGSSARIMNAIAGLLGKKKPSYSSGVT